MAMSSRMAPSSARRRPQPDHRGDVPNFVLDFQFQLTPGANNGLGIHYPGTGDCAYPAWKCRFSTAPTPKYKDLKDYQFHGGLYTMVPATQGFLKPVGEWNQERVTVMGPTLKVELNGEIILRANLDELAYLPTAWRSNRHAGQHSQRQGPRRPAAHRRNPPPATNNAGVVAAFHQKCSRAALADRWRTPG